MKPRVSARAVGFVAAFAWLALVAGCQRQTASAESDSPPPAPPVAVEVVRVSASDTAGTIRATGLTAWKRETGLGFAAPGEIETVAVDMGDKVISGQMLATLRRTAVGADAAEAALARKTAELAYERTERLHASGAASQADLDGARLALERTRQTLTLTAPAGGMVLRRDAERGQVVNAGQAVIWVGEVGSGLIVKAQATSTQAAKISVGPAAEVRVRHGMKLAGVVERIAPRSVGQTGVFEIEVRLPEPGDLRSGEIADVVLQGASKEWAQSTAFIIPALALTDARADQGMVFIVGPDNRVERRAVSTGGLSTEGVLVLSGLSPGDAVITRGAATVREGDTVTVVAP